MPRKASKTLETNHDASDGSIIEIIDLHKRNTNNKSKLGRSISYQEDRESIQDVESVLSDSRRMDSTSEASNSSSSTSITTRSTNNRPRRRPLQKPTGTHTTQPYSTDTNRNTTTRHEDKRINTEEIADTHITIRKPRTNSIPHKNEPIIRPTHIKEDIEYKSLPEIGDGGSRGIVQNWKEDSSDTSAPIDSIPKIDVSNPIPRTNLDGLSQTELERMLNIKWSKFIPDTHRPFPKQLAALMLAEAREVFFGGAAGGGKSDWLLMECLRFCDLPGFSCIVFRKQLTDLKQAGGLIPRTEQWLMSMKEQGLCRYDGSEHKWAFKTTWPGTDIPAPDATLQWGYIGEANVRERYMSAEFQLICFEELANWADDTDYTYMYSRLRKNKCIIHGADEYGNPIYQKGCRYCDVLSQIPLRMRAASNPGPAWIKRRFGIIPDPSQFKTRHEALVAISEGIKVRWVGTRKDRPFIPSYLDDNKAIDVNAYRESLHNLNEEDRSRLEDGNWEARKNSRFKRRWEQFYYLNVESDLLKSELPFSIETPKFNRDAHTYSLVHTDRQGNHVIGDPIPLSTCSIFTTVDTAVTTKQGPVDGELGNKRSYCVVSTWARTHNDYLLYLNMRKFRREIPDFVESIVQVNELWHPYYNKVEVNGVGMGVAQYLERAGLPVRRNYRSKDKLENSLPAQILMKNGRYLFPLNTEWLEEAEDDIFNWTGLPEEEDDIIDTLCDAAPEVAMTVAREISAPNIVRSRPTAVSMQPFNSGRIPKWGF